MFIVRPFRKCERELSFLWSVEAGDRSINRENLVGKYTHYFFNCSVIFVIANRISIQEELYKIIFLLIVAYYKSVLIFFENLTKRRRLTNVI